MNLLDMLQQDGVTPRKVADTNGGEYAAPCPGCGGEDRFRVWPEQGKGGRFWCRGCEKKGDAIQYLRDFQGKPFREAERIVTGELSVPRKTPLKEPNQARQGNDNEPSSPCQATWGRRAIALVEYAEKTLWSPVGNEMLAWLRVKRGLSDDTIKRFHLGMLDQDFYSPRDKWGLPPQRNDKGKLKKVWTPAGLVIPTIDEQGNNVVRVKIRRHAEAEPRYILVPGSTMTTWILRQGDVFVVVESELDGLLLLDRTSSDIGVIVLGSAQARPDEQAMKRLAQALTILVALDADEAGASQSWEWWRRNVPQAKRWPPVNGKDPGEMYQKGLDVGTWIEAGIEFHRQQPPATPRPPVCVQCHPETDDEVCIESAFIPDSEPTRQDDPVAEAYSANRPPETLDEAVRNVLVTFPGTHPVSMTTPAMTAADIEASISRITEPSLRVRTDALFATGQVTARRLAGFLLLEVVTPEGQIVTIQAGADSPVTQAFTQTY